MNSTDRLPFAKIFPENSLLYYIAVCLYIEAKVTVICTYYPSILDALARTPPSPTAAAIPIGRGHYPTVGVQDSSPPASVQASKVRLTPAVLPAKKDAL